MGDVADRVRRFITTELLYGEDPAALTDASPLLEGTLDSLGLMQLIAFIEEEFDVAIDDAEVTREHFRTVGDIERLINQKARVG